VIVFPGPGIYRGMQEEKGLPKIGDSPKKLGVRLPPNPKADIQPDANGFVYPPSATSSGGMSCAPRIQKLPAHRRPVAWNGTVMAVSFKVWGIDEDDLGPDLLAFRDSPNHITIGPARKMPIQQFQAALEATQSKWKEVVP